MRPAEHEGGQDSGESNGRASDLDSNGQSGQDSGGSNGRASDLDSNGQSGQDSGSVLSAPVIAPLLPAGMPVAQISPIVLAYIGDAVFEVYVRQRLIAGAFRKPHELHRAATRFVSAASQARLLQQWMPYLTAEEADVVRRGRNAKSGQPPRNADLADYRHATALECLIGYLYYEGRRDRLEQLIASAFRDQPH